MNRQHLFELLIVAGILLLAAYLRLHNLAHNPGWYTDEGTHLDIARNLLVGEVAYFAVDESILLFGRPPLFGWILAASMNIFGISIETLRGLTAAFGVLCVGLIYVTTRRITQDRFVAILAALLLAMYPQAVLYARFGFSYALLGPLVLLCLYGLAEYLKNGARVGLALAAGAIGIGLTGDLMMGALIPVLLAALVWQRWRDLWWGLALMILPFGAYALVMLLTNPDSFLFDLDYTLFRLNRLSLLDQIGNAALNYTTLISQDSWMLAGIIGLFLLRPLRLRILSLALLLVPLALLGRTVALHSLSYYYITPLLPLVALGLAALIRVGFPWIVTTVSDYWQTATRISKTSGYIAAFSVIAVPLITTLILTIQQVNTSWPTAIDPFLIDGRTAREAAEFVNNATEPDDLVIASPAVGWLLNTQVADFQMSVAARGIETVHLPGELPAERWRFDPDFQRARFVVVDNLWRNWAAVHMPAVAVMLAAVEDWPQVFEAGVIVIHRNPQVD